MSFEEFVVFTVGKLEYINGELSELPLLRIELELLKIQMAVLEVQLVNMMWWFKVVAVAAVGAFVAQLAKIVWDVKRYRNGK